MATSSNVAQRHSYPTTLLYFSAQHFYPLLFFVVFKTCTLPGCPSHNSKVPGGAVQLYPITYNTAWLTQSLS